MHETFYRGGVHVDPEQHWGVGWTTLEGSFSDCLPVWNEARDLVLFFHGDHYADPAIVEDLKRHHDIAIGHDARHLIHLYEERGAAFFQELNGFFHGVLVDLKNRRFLLFNDRYGMQRLFYHEADGVFAFAAEAKALLKINPRLREIAPESLGEYFSMQCVLENRTLFRDVYTLPGGMKWSFRDGVAGSREKYFDARTWEDQPVVSEAEYFDRLKATYQEVLPRYMRSTGKVGLSLTGGLDSRLIMAGHRPAPGTMPCHTFASTYNDSVDLRIAGEVARVSAQPHTAIRIGQPFLDGFASLARKAVYISDGYIDAASGGVEIYANRIARGLAPVRVTGNYGSEVLRAVRAFRHRVPSTDLFTPELLDHCAKAQSAFTRTGEGHPLTFSAFRQAAWYNYNRRSLEQSQLDTRTPFMDNRIVACAYGAPHAALLGDAVFLRLLHELYPEVAAIRTNRGAGYGQSRLMAGITNAYREFWHKAEYCYDYNLPHIGAKLDLALKPLHLERVFLGREKFSFFRMWYRDQLAGCLKEILLDPQFLGAPFVNRKRVEAAVHAHIHGHENHTKAITLLLTYALTRDSLLK